MEIRKLNPEEWAGKQFHISYTTDGYFDVHPCSDGFVCTRKPFPQPQEKSFDDTFLSEWLENPVAYGIFEHGQMIGYAEGSIEQWNNCFRISNILVFDQNNRKKGIGSVLMKQILKEAKDSGARMAVLETQSCNINAISFYYRFGFQIIGFDLFAFTNQDMQNHEVRIEMGKIL